MVLIYTLGTDMYFKGTNVYPLGTKVYFLKRYIPSDSFCTFFPESVGVCLFREGAAKILDSFTAATNAWKNSF